MYHLQKYLPIATLLSFVIVGFHRKNCSDFNSDLAWRIFYKDLRILLIQLIADLSNILARIVDLYSLHFSLDPGLWLHSRAFSGFKFRQDIVGSRILLQIWADRRICIPLFNPPPPLHVEIMCIGKCDGLTIAVWAKYCLIKKIQLCYQRRDLSKG
jgi:hypothetical protein